MYYLKSNHVLFIVWFVTAEEIKSLMKENERLRTENKRFQDLMKTLQIPPNGVANPSAYLKSKGKKSEPKLLPLSKNTSASGSSSSNVKPVVTNTAKVLTTNQNTTILPVTNPIGGVTQVGTNQVVNQGASGTTGNAILVQNPNGGYFLVPTNKNVTFPLQNNQGAQNIAPNQITIVTCAGQVVNSSNGSNKVTIGQATLTTSSVGTTTTATTQAVSTPIASAAPQGGAPMQAPGMMQTIRYLVPMMPGSGNQTTTQTVMVMAKPNNQNVPIRIAPQQPIRIAGSQPQVILPQPAGVTVSTNQNVAEKSDSKKKSSPPKIKNLCSTDADSESSNVNTSGTTTQSTIAPAPVAIQTNTTNQPVAPNQVVLQRPPGQTTGGPVTMQVVQPKPVTQQFVYLQGQNGQLIPVVIQNPNAQQNTTVIQQPAQQQTTVGSAPNQTLMTIPINQNGQGMINNRPIVVVSQPPTSAVSGTGIITSANNSITTTSAGMSPLTVLTSQSSSSSANAADDILAKAAESIFSPNTLNDNSPTLNLNEMAEGATNGASTTATPCSTASINSLPPFPVSVSRVDDEVVTYLQSVSSQSETVASPVETDSHGKKQKKNKKKKKKKEKSKDKEKTKDKSKDKDKKKHKQKNKEKDKTPEKPEEDHTIIKELDRGMANSIDALPDSTSGTAIITDTLLQEWIEKESGLNNPEQDGDSRDETITNVTANQDKDKDEEVMDTAPVATQNSTNIPSSYSAEALLASSNDTPQPNSSAATPVTTTVTTSSLSTPATSSSSGETTGTNSTHNPFGSFPSFNFGSDILSNSMSVSGLPTYIEDEQSEDAKSSSNNGLSSLKALGSMRDSILSFGSSQGNQTQASQQPQNDQANNQQTQNNTDDKSSRSASPVDSLPMNSPPAAPERVASSPESTHGFSNSPEPTNLFGSGSGLLSDTLESKDTSLQDQEEEEPSDAPSNEPSSSFPASHNSSWISNHSRASHLASGLKKKKPPAPPTSLPIPVPVTTTSSSSSSMLSSSESSAAAAANIPPSFYTLPWLGPPKSTPMPLGSNNSENSSNSIQPEKSSSFPTPTYLPTQRSSSPSYVPNQHSSAASYLPQQRSSSPTYVPSSHRSSPPLYFPKLSSAPTSLSTSSPLTIDTSMAPSIFSSSGSLNTPTNCSVITTAPQGASVSTTNASAKFKLRPPAKMKFSPSTIHRTLTSGITEEESPEKGEEQKSEPRPQRDQQQKEWQHKLPMQIKPGPEIRSKEGNLAAINATAQPGSLKKNKRSKKKKAALAAAAAAAAAAKEAAEGDRSNLEDIGKRDLPKNLVDQFPWLADEEEKKAAKNQGHQSDRATSFSIQSITQQSSGKTNDPAQNMSKSTTPTPRMPPGIPGIPRTSTQSKGSSSVSQSSPASSGTPFWNPSTTGSYPRTTDSTTSVTISKQSSVDSAPSMPSKSRIDYMPRQSPTSHSSSAVSSSANLPQHNQRSPVPIPTFGGSGSDKEMPSPLSMTSTPRGNESQPSSSSRGKKSSTQRKQSNYSQKQSNPGDTTASPLNSPPDSSNSPLFSDFPLALAPNLVSNHGIDNRSTSGTMNQKQDSSPRLQMESQTSPSSQRAPSRGSALPTPPAENYLFSPTNSSSSTANQGSIFSNPPTNRSDNNQSDGEDFMTLAQAEKSLEFLPSTSPDQSQNVDAIDLSSLPMFDTPASTPRSTPSNLQTSMQSSTPLQRQQQQQPISGRSSVERQSPFDQSPTPPSNIRTGPPNQQMYSMPNTAQRQVVVTSSQSMASQSAARSQVHNRFMPSPEMQQPNQGTKRPANDNLHPQPSSKRPAGAGMPHHNQLPMSLMQGQDASRGVVLERAPPASHTSHIHRVEPPSQTSHIHRVDHGMHRGQTPPTTVSQQVGSPHSALQHNRHPSEQQASSGSDISRVPTYDLSQSVAHQRIRSAEMTPSSRQDIQRAPTYDLTQSVGSQRNRSIERQSSMSESVRTPRYDLSQSAGAQRTRSVEQHHVPVSETQRVPTYDLTQSAGTQRTKVSSESQRMPTYDLAQSAGTQRTKVSSESQRVPTYDLAQSAGTHRPKVSEPQRMPTYDLTQSAGTQRPKVSEPQRMPTYDLTQSAGTQRQKASETQRMPMYDLAQSAGTQRQKASEPQRMPTYDLTQSAGTQRPKTSETQRMPTYDLTQSAGTQRPKISEPQRIPTYDLTQSAGTQRTRSAAERSASGSAVQRTPVYDLSQSAGAQRNPVERHQPARSETQRMPTYDLSQSASAQRARSTERPSSASESQRIPTYDLTQSPHRDPVPPKQRKRPQNNTEQYFSSSENTSSLRHMDSSNIAQESNPWPGFPTQRVPNSEPSFLPNFASPSSQSLPSSMSQTETVNTSSSASIVPSLSPSRRVRTDMPTYLPHHPHLAPILSSPPQASKTSIGREADISTPFNPMFPPAHTRAGLGMNVAPNFPPVFHEHGHQPPPFNVTKGQLPGGVGVHPAFNFNNIFNEVPGPNTSHSDTPSGMPVHAMHLHGNPGMSVEDSMAHMRGSVPGRHVHGHPQAFGNNMRIESLLSQNVSADGRTFKVGVPPMGTPFPSFGPGMPF